MQVASKTWKEADLQDEVVRLRSALQKILEHYDWKEMVEKTATDALAAAKGTP
jgi:fructose/tagatose bisphosphate aldolase